MLFTKLNQLPFQFTSLATAFLEAGCHHHHRSHSFLYRIPHRCHDLISRHCNKRQINLIRIVAQFGLYRQAKELINFRVNGDDGAAETGL